MNIDKIRELRALVAEMTPGPWETDDRYASEVYRWDGEQKTWFDTEYGPDGKGIVALRNSADDLLKWAEEAWGFLAWTKEVREHPDLGWIGDPVRQVPCSKCGTPIVWASKTVDPICEGCAYETARRLLGEEAKP